MREKNVIVTKKTQTCVAESLHLRSRIKRYGGGLGTSSFPENKISYTPPGKLSRSRQYRVNQFKLFKSMYPWFWSLSLWSLSLTFFIFLSVLYLSIYLSVQNILFVKTNILHVFVQTNILFVRWNVLHPNKPISSKKIILCPKISTDPEPCYYTSWTAWFGTLYKCYCLFSEQYGFLCEQYG